MNIFFFWSIVVRGKYIESGVGRLLSWLGWDFVLGVFLGIEEINVSGEGVG